jgi:hypothetical protein
MIICSCTLICNRQIERALVEILSVPNAPLPTPGIVYRHLEKRMECCGCASLAVATIYALVEKLEQDGRVCPCACASTRAKLSRLGKKRLDASELEDVLLLASE